MTFPQPSRRAPPSRTALPLLALALALLPACGGSETGDLDTGEQDLSGVRLRVMEGNLTSGNAQSYEQYGMRIFQGLKPDIALVQECNYQTSSPADIDTFIHTTFGPTFSYYREANAAFQIPNCVVSRYPIVLSGSYTDPAVANRAFAWAKIELPDGKLVWAFSLHLLTTSSSNRDTEAKALVADIKAGIPDSDYVIIGGDFNTGSRTEACVGDLSAVVVTAAPYPVDNKGNADTSESRSKPHDWLLASPALDAQKIPAIVGSSTFPDGLVVDTRVYTPLSDIAPALAGDSGADSMQHMGVVRDFLLTGAAAGSDAGTPPDGGASDAGTHTDGGGAGQGDAGPGMDGGTPAPDPDAGTPRRGLFPAENPDPIL